jgi:hypothetical protein
MPNMSTLIVTCRLVTVYLLVFQRDSARIRDVGAWYVAQDLAMLLSITLVMQAWVTAF